MNIYNPIYIEKYNIYDIFYNDIGNIVIIQPCENNPNSINLNINNKFLNFNIEICPHNHTHIYYLNENSFIYNDNIEIELYIDNDKITTKINKYPIFENEIIMSTIVKDEDKYILQWINYHNKLGISKFIIYDNSNNNTLDLLLNEYINDNVVILIKWCYPYYLKKSGFSGQTTQQNHSIYAFNTCKYIGLFDIDEYVNLQEPYININNFLTDIVNKNNINIDTIGGFQLLNKCFYNPNNLSVDDNNFLKIYNCDNITLNDREKNFIIPKNVKTFSIHMITNGLPINKLSNYLIYFNHYYFLNKTDRGFDKTDLIDTSISRLCNLFNIY